MNYLEWNDKIGARFFNPDRGGMRVFLYVNEAVIAEIGSPHNAGRDDFVAAVKTGPPWNTRHGWSICQQALQALEDWRSRNLQYPPYIGYLALFVWAGTVDVGFARHSYYPGLRSLLGETPKIGSYPSFDYMHHLWDDLAVWSNQDRHGDWGIFDADIVGEWISVGLPKSQTLLTDEERDNLPILFADNGLDPHAPPSDREIAYLLANDPHHYLRPHTKDLLRSTGKDDSPIRIALLETLFNELEHWDGTVPDQTNTGIQTRNSHGNLRLAMILDQTARTARFSLRCISNCGYPDEGLQLVGGEMQVPLYCYEDWQGWSTPLSDTETQMRVFDPSHFDWQNGLSLIDREHSWKAALSKRPVRVMVRATPFGFDGFVEDSQIPQGKPFYLLAHNNHAAMIHAWGTEYCDSFSEIDLISGLPNGWKLYSVEHANSDAIIRDAFPFLAFHTIMRIQLRGGLKVRGNQYFTFALPQIEVTGTVGAVNVFCNDVLLESESETGMFRIPDTFCSNRLIIEVRDERECLRRRSLYAMETLAWRDTVPTAYLDKFGHRVENGATEKCSGPIVDGVKPPEFNPEIFLPPSTGRRMYFVGRNPGEIADCPKEPIPNDWRPVWAILMHKRGKGTAVYCGTEPATEAPGTTICVDRKRRSLWKEILWHGRMRITCPTHPTLRALWQRYKEVAHSVR